VGTSFKMLIVATNAIVLFWVVYYKSVPTMADVGKPICVMAAINIITLLVSIVLDSAETICSDDVVNGEFHLTYLLYLGLNLLWVVVTVACCIPAYTRDPGLLTSTMEIFIYRLKIFPIGVAFCLLPVFVLALSVMLFDGEGSRILWLLSAVTVSLSGTIVAVLLSIFPIIDKMKRQNFYFLSAWMSSAGEPLETARDESDTTRISAYQMNTTKSPLSQA
jgi:hypothetical protein